TLADLKREPLIVREQGSGSREALEHALGEANVDLTALRVVGEMGSTQAIKQAVRSGVGISIISKRAVDDECKAALLSCVKLKDLRVSPFFYLITHRARSRSPLAQAFVDFVESQLPTRASQSTDDRAHSHRGPAHLLRVLRRLSVQNGSWRSPGGVGGTQA